MSDTTYVDYTTPAVSAEWLNEINDHVWHDTPTSGTTVHGLDKISFIQNGSGTITRIAQDKVRENISISDFTGSSNTVISSAISAIGQTQREIDLVGTSITATVEPTNPYGARFKYGKLLVPSLIATYSDQRNTYADDVNGLMIGRENLAAFMLACSAGTLQNIHMYGDSTIENGGDYPIYSHSLVQRALYQAGINRAKTFNHGLSGTSWSDLSALGDLGASTKLIIIKYGINDAVKANALATLAADARSKLTAIRAAAYGDYANLSILLMGPNSTYRPSTGQAAQWYEDLRNIYLQLCKEFDCAYFDTYAYLQNTRRAPGMWLDDVGGGEGIHPSPVAIYWIFYEGFLTHVLGNGVWNSAKSNCNFNIDNYTRIALTSRTPAGYIFGVTTEAALTSNGWPYDGVVVTVKHADGIAVQTVYSQDVVPRTASRRGSGAIWTQWAGQSTNISSFLNSWAAKGGGYQSPGYSVGADGYVELYGVMSGGTIGLSSFTLPTNVRPAFAHTYPCTSGGTITVFADGNVITVGGTNTTVSLGGMRFKVL